eukprot:scaffold92_cov124-Isochrysis_galbana.AAC.2
MEIGLLASNPLPRGFRMLLAVHRADVAQLAIPCRPVGRLDPIVLMHGWISAAASSDSTSIPHEHLDRHGLVRGCV